MAGAEQIYAQLLPWHHKAVLCVLCLCCNLELEAVDKVSTTRTEGLLAALGFMPP